MELAGKSAIVTGGGKGLGRAITQVLAERVAAVVTIGRNRTNLEAVQEDIRRHGGTIEIIQGDVGSRDDVQRTVEVALSRFNGIDILVTMRRHSSSVSRSLTSQTRALKFPFGADSWAPSIACRRVTRT